MMSDVKVHRASAGSSTDTSPDHSGEAQPNKSPSYVVHVPKDQIYRVPPPENAHRYKLYTRRGLRKRRSCCCCCIAWIFWLVAAVALAVGVAAVLVYFAFDPKMPSFSVSDLTVKGFNLSYPVVRSKSFIPEFDVTVRVENPNQKVEIQYMIGSSLEIYYSDVKLGEGAWPPFSQKQNVTWVWAALRGSEIRLSGKIHRDLEAEQQHGEVPLVVGVGAPAKIKVGATTSWTVTCKVRCAVKVDRLVPNSKIVSKEECDLKIRLF